MSERDPESINFYFYVNNICPFNQAPSTKKENDGGETIWKRQQHGNEREDQFSNRSIMVGNLGC
jgi:hypothetical protein